MKHCLAVGALLVLALATSDSAKSVSPGQQILDETSIQLPWDYDLRDYPLERSKGSIKLLPGLALLRGKPAQSFLTRVQGLTLDHSEAVLINPETGSQWVLNYYPSGHIALDTWSEVDPAALLTNMKQAALIENDLREGLELPDLTVTGWMQKPLVDSQSHSVSWAVALTQDDRKVVNAIALKLGRTGFEKMTWVGTENEYLNTKATMHKVIEAHEFPYGLRYEDFETGDSLAGLTLPQLVALTTGGNVAVEAGTEGLIARAPRWKQVLVVIPVLLVFGIAVLGIKKISSGSSQRAQAPTGT